jgi:hypothetical protein
MSGEFDILSVAEDNNRLDRLTGEASIENGKLRISVDEDSNMTVMIEYYQHCIRPGPPHIPLVLKGVNLKELIHFLGEAKQFIDEQEVMNRLMGKK